MRTLIHLAAAAALLAGCAAPRTAGPDPLAEPRLVRAPSPPAFVSLRPEEDRDVAAAAAAYARALEAGERRARPVGPRQTPILYGSPEGRAFLDLPPEARAMAIGAPPRSCPARVVAGSSEAAMSACRAALAAADAPDGCGCVIIADGSALIAPEAAFAYAPGVSARILSRAFDLDLTLVAREEAARDGGRRLLFHPAPGDRLTVDIAPDGAATATWDGPDGRAVLRGRRIADGLRRGRYAERIAAQDEAGRRILIIVGFEPVEFAVRRRELTRWPDPR